MDNPKIISDPKILSGKPIIAGTRITVELILDRFASGMSEKQILEDYPHLSSNQIQAAVAYAKKVISQKNHKLVKNRTTATTLYRHEISR